MPNDKQKLNKLMVHSLDKVSPWGRWGLDTTEQLHFHFSLSCIGEGNGDPLQCSCLENPRDGGAWWAAVYGVAQSRTRLKWLSSLAIIKMFKNTLSWVNVLVIIVSKESTRAHVCLCEERKDDKTPSQLSSLSDVAAAAAAAAESCQSCPTLCDPWDGSPPGSPIPGILQARTLEWVAISFSDAWKWKVKAKSRSRVRLFTTTWTAGYQGNIFFSIYFSMF